MKVYPELFEDGPKICFLHLPKTGGKTFRQICKNQFENCNHIRVSNGEALKYLHKLPIEDLAMIDFIHGHFPLAELPVMPSRFRYFTWLRDPVERIISLYNYWMYSKRPFELSAVHMVRDRAMTFEDFISTDIPEIKYWQYPYLTLLGTGISAYGTPVEIMEQGLEEAARVLLTHFDFVGITERFDEGLEYIQERFGFRTDYTIANVTPPWAKAKTVVTDEQRERLREWLKPEYMIYEFAKEIFEKRIDKIPHKERVYENSSTHSLSYGEQGHTW